MLDDLCSIPNPKIMLISDAPTLEDERAHTAFSSSQGQLIKSMLKNIGVRYQDCYFTNVVQQRPAGSNFDSLYEDGKKRKIRKPALQMAIDHLHDKIKKIRPNIVVLFGTEALKAVLGKDSITAWRGSLCMLGDIKVIATYHPSTIFKQYEQRAIAEMDLKRARDESAYPEDRRDQPTMLVMPSYEQTLKWFDELYAAKPDRVSFDLETTYETLLIRSIGLAYMHPKTKKKHACSIVVMKKAPFAVTGSTKITLPQGPVFTSVFHRVQEAKIIDMLNDLMRDTSIKKVGHNSISFDQTILEEQYGIRINNHYMDTMHAHHVCYLELPKSLDFACTFYTQRSNYWSDKQTDDDASNALYNCWDCVVTLECSYALEEELQNLGMYDLYFKHVHPLAFVLTRAGNYGVKYDREKAEQLHAKYTAEMKDIVKWFEHRIGYVINLDSPKQLQELLYEKEKFPVQYSNKRTVTTDAEAIKKLVKKYPQEELLQKLLRYRTISKLAGTYLTAKFDDDGVIRTSFNVSGTDTGRISSSANLRGTGGNLQNIPPDLRALYVAREGYSIVKFDLKQAETLVVAELLARYGDFTLVRRYEDPEFDIHKWAAAGIFGVDEHAVTKEQRNIGKLRNHSGNYGAGPQVLVSQSIKRGIVFDGQVGISYAMSKRILDAGHRLIPGLKKWWRGVEQQLKHTRVLSTCLGRKRLFFGRLDESMFRTAYAFEPQSTVGDVTNIIIRRMEEWMDDDCHLLLQVHDEGDFEVPDDKIDDFVALLYEAGKVELPLCPGRPPLIIPLEIKVGKTWGELKDYANAG